MPSLVILSQSMNRGTANETILVGMENAKQVEYAKKAPPTASPVYGTGRDPLKVRLKWVEMHGSMFLYRSISPWVTSPTSCLRFSNSRLSSSEEQNLGQGRDCIRERGTRIPRWMRCIRQVQLSMSCWYRSQCLRTKESQEWRLGVEDWSTREFVNKFTMNQLYPYNQLSKHSYRFQTLSVVLCL